MHRNIAKVEQLFRKQVQKDPNVRNGFLLIHSERNGIHLNIAEGSTAGAPAHPQQPNYMASVGKLFTATLIGILSERGQLSFGDSITKYLDQDVVHQLHQYKGRDYSADIEIRHLLNHTSGLHDNFRPLLERVIADPDFHITPQEALTWTKENGTPHFAPGDGFKYSDTNYHLLGLIIEAVTGKSFHEVLKEEVFEPLDMKNAFMLGYSEPLETPSHATADFFTQGIKLNESQAYANLDYSGGGVVAPLEDFLKFMKALVRYQVIAEETLDTMKKDKAKFGLGIDYGYGIWQFRAVPLLMPKKFCVWGVAGVTGAFMFYHPDLDTYLIGNFNDFSYERKGLQYMLFKVIKKL